MQIVIEIPEEVKKAFDDAKNEDLYGNYYDYNSIIGKAIINGTPLPKGNGNKYEAKAITRGNCMMCGKELTEGLFFCKECEDKGKE